MRWLLSLPKARSDADGNLLTQTTIATGAMVEYAYDAESHLTSVTNINSSDQTTQVVDYTYDMYGELIGRSITPYSDGGAGTTTTARFVFDGNQMVLAFDGSGNLTERILNGPAVDHVLATEQVSSLGSTGAVSWLLPDNQGTIRDVIDSSGDLLDHLTYNSFGQLTGQSGSATYAATAAIFGGYTGSFYDSATGLTWDAARWYNSVAQRFQNPDPSGLGPDSNPYRYTDNDPTNGTDPSGDIFMHGMKGNSVATNRKQFDDMVTSVEHFGRTTVGTITELPSAYWDTAVEGKQQSSLNGFVDSETSSLNPFGGGTHIGPAYGQGGAYSGGQKVGSATALVTNAVLTVSGVEGVVNSVRAIRAAGGLLQVAQVALADGRVIEVVVGGTGAAVELTPTVAANLGIAAIGGKNLINAAMSGTPKGSSGSSAGAPSGVPKPTAADPKLQNITNDLYKGANTPNPIGSGSTADAIRNELATGRPTYGTFHSDKGRQYISALTNWLARNPSASPSDISAAQLMLNDLKSALGVK